MRTLPGTLDLGDRLPADLYAAAQVAAARAVCDAAGHPPGCFNPWHGTYCRCGFVVYPGNHAPLPRPHVREAPPWAGPVP